MRPNVQLSVLCSVAIAVAVSCKAMNFTTKYEYICGEAIKIM